MSLGQWGAIVDAHTKANGGTKTQPPTDEEFEIGVLRAREITDGAG